MKTALLIIDIQNDYFDLGKNPLYKSKETAKNASKALEMFRKKGLPIIHIQHINTQENALFFRPETNGVLIHELVSPIGKEKVIIKHRPDSFYQTDLESFLTKERISHLVICGMMSHMCIDTTVRVAKSKDYTITLLEDACTTMDLTWNTKSMTAKEVQATFMASLRGMFAEVINTSALENML